jgi:hypothetical protein
MKIDFEALGKEILEQVKGQLAGLGADVKEEIVPDLKAIASDVIRYGEAYARGEDVTSMMLHLRAQGVIIGGLIATNAGNRMQATLVMIIETAARVLGVALKAAL